MAPSPPGFPATSFSLYPTNSRSESLFALQSARASLNAAALLQCEYSEIGTDSETVHPDSETCQLNRPLYLTTVVHSLIPLHFLIRNEHCGACSGASSSSSSQSASPERYLSGALLCHSRWISHSLPSHSPIISHPAIHCCLSHSTV